MTEVKFNANRWFSQYNCDVDTDQINRKLLRLDRVSDVSTVGYKDFMTAILDVDIDDNAIVKIDNKDINARLIFKGKCFMDYDVETNLSHEDAEQAERNLNAAIKSGETVFKVSTVARPRKNCRVEIRKSQIIDQNDEEIADKNETAELIKHVMNGKVTDLGDYSFISEIVPILEDERIEVVCRVEQVENNYQEFHAEDWVNYYNAKIDERYLSDYIDNCFEGYPDAKIEMSGDTITTHVESGFSYRIGMFFEDKETGEEVETESDVVADFAYTVVYKVDDDLDDFIEDIEEALNNAINNEESAFEIIAPIKVVEVRNVEVTDVENHGLDDEIVERINGGESAIVKEIQSSIENDLSESTDARHSGDFIQPPIGKEVKFICTIPTK